MPAYLFSWICNAPDDDAANTWFSDCTDKVSASPVQCSLTGCTVVGESIAKTSGDQSLTLA